MRRSRPLVVLALAVCLACAVTVLRAEDTAAAIVGTWELAGFGDVAQRGTLSARMHYAFDPSGRFDYRVWETEGEGPFEVSGVWTVKNDLLTVQPLNAQALKAGRQVYRVDWDGSTLLMYPPKEGNHDPIPLRFEKKGAY